MLAGLDIIEEVPVTLVLDPRIIEPRFIEVRPGKACSYGYEVHYSLKRPCED